MAEIIFKRKIYQKILKWKEQSNGETALLIEGARRVGKSTIVEEFAKNEYKSYIIIDFANASQEEIGLFNNISDLNFFFTKLMALKHVSLFNRQSVIVFDEVQNHPSARQAIKYLVKDGRYDYIETGSLISIHKNVTNIVIPSEEEVLEMFPMDYEEFRWALGDTVTIPLLREQLQKRQSLGDHVNRKLMRDFRLYMLVGGMPQAVCKYIETLDLSQVDKTKRSILRIYEQDFNKLDSSGRATAMFKAIPSQLHNNSTRFKTTKVLGKSIYNISLIIQMLEESKTVNAVFRADDPNVGLELSADHSSYKLFIADTGLFVTLAFSDKDYTENIIYSKLLSDKLDANLGYVYENAVAQAIASSGYKLFYHSWLDRSNHAYEVDFLLSKGFKITPIEVKSSGYNTHRSLDEFCQKYSDRISSPYLIYTKDLRRDGSILMIPIYMAGLI